jgi:hypothetical protein
MTPGYYTNHRAIVQNFRPTSQVIRRRPVVKTTVNPSQFSGSIESSERLVDYGAAGEVCKVAGRPDCLKVVGDAFEYPAAQPGFASYVLPCPKYAAYFGHSNFALPTRRETPRRTTDFEGSHSWPPHALAAHVNRYYWDKSPD